MSHRGTLVRLSVAASLSILGVGCSEPSPTTGPQPSAAGEAACTEASIHCGAAPSVQLTEDDDLWAAFEYESHVYVTRSEDFGDTFSTPVRVNPEPEAIETNGENRPKIEVAKGRVFVSWTRKLEGRFNADIRFTRSLDRGRSFEPVRTVNDDGLVIGHRFETLHRDERDHLYLVWVDKRDQVAARERGEEYRGAAIYYTVSTDDGATFAANRRVADHACECCRIATADVAGGGVAILWRHVFAGQVRDHAFATLGVSGLTSAPGRATVDGWHIKACPHHGPALWKGPGGYHMTWFTGAGGQPTVHYGLFDPASGVLRNATRVATSAAAHPFLVGTEHELFLVWKQAEEDLTVIHHRRSVDQGTTWEERGAVASTKGASDHPFLLLRYGEPYLVWHTAREGLRILPVG